MILGSNCTRNCRFCNVTSKSSTPVDPDEPKRVADTVLKLKLTYVVVTSVTRGDLPDGGASHFERVIQALKPPDTLLLKGWPQTGFFVFWLPASKSTRRDLNWLAKFDRTLKIQAYALWRNFRKFS